MAPPTILHAEAPLLRAFMLPASAGHALHVSVWGRANGIPALVLHGGPGSGCSPLLRQFFDPARYRVICIDQRGAGLSRPRGGIEANSLDHLLDDLRRLRERLEIARWLVVGGSWGATLGIAHAADEPQAIAGLLLRAAFLARPEDIASFFQDPTGQHAAHWQRFAAVAPPAEQGDLLPWLARRLARAEATEARRIALAWRAWEAALSGQPAPAQPDAATLDALVDRYRVQSHILNAGCGLIERPLLDRCADAPPVPTLLLHARDDRICRPEGAVALHARLPHATLRWVEQGGHDPAQPAMARAMVDALDDYAETKHFTAREDSPVNEASRDERRAAASRPATPSVGLPAYSPDGGLTADERRAAPSRPATPSESRPAYSPDGGLTADERRAAPSRPATPSGGRPAYSPDGGLTP